MGLEFVMCLLVAGRLSPNDVRDLPPHRFTSRDSVILSHANENWECFESDLEVRCLQATILDVKKGSISLALEKDAAQCLDEMNTPGSFQS